MTEKKDNRDLTSLVRAVVDETPVFDIHTHLFDAGFGSLLLWGADELLTYHYLVAEVFRVAPMPYDRFWRMTKTEQADYIWKHLFIERSPLSEACRGVVTCFSKLGFDMSARSLDPVREYFRLIKVDDYVDRVFKLANVREAVMTNDPFDGDEHPVWKKTMKRDPRFRAALRIDRLLVDWGKACEMLKGWGYDVEQRLGSHTLSEIRRFLTDWAKMMKPAYMAASLPPTFMYPEASSCGKIIDDCILPVGQELNLPFALMIGVKKLINPDLRLAGDSVGKASISAVERLCADNPDNKFLVTMLSRENQHELCVTARKYHNLMIFGCWWFLNNPSIIGEMTRERIELLGLSMIPQHSDARILDQLVYKWDHSRSIIAEVLVDKYTDLKADGWIASKAEIERDVSFLFGKAFEDFLKR